MQKITIKFIVESKSHLPRQRWQAEGFPHDTLHAAATAQRDIQPKRSHTRIVKIETTETPMFET